ncbi:MAG: carboxymuconolactone decarboxylase family protein [Bacteroidia bacterium]
MITETLNDLLSDLNIAVDEGYSIPMQQLNDTENRYLKDLRINLKNVLQSEYLTEKETALLAYAIAVNASHKNLQKSFTEIAKEKDATLGDLAETAACASLLAANNVLYRFRHFTAKEKYEQLPARIKMNIMMNPVIGKEFFELVSLAVSAVNGCEACVKSHEQSLIHLGSSEERIFDAIRIASVIQSLNKIIG